MGEVYKNNDSDESGLELNNPKSDLTSEKPEEDQYITVVDEHGKNIKLKVIFSVRDNVNQAAYLFVDQGNDSVLGLATKIDEKGNPLQEELEVIDEKSPYIDYAEIYLEAYNDGTIENTAEVEKKVQALKDSKAKK